MTISGTKGFWYGDLPQELADATTAKLGCQSYASFLSKLTHTPWDDVPVVWIRCLKDQAYPLLAQDRMIENIGGPGKTKIIDLDSSHSPMLSMPMRCADVIVEACSGIAPSG